jgi:L-lysine exporter family protein LysE/ArgO
MLPAYLQGLGLGAGLIIAIGAQNAHVLRMGIKCQHIALTVSVCILCDVVLIAAGVAGMGAVIGRNPVLLALARWGGAGFLAWYGVRAWRAAWMGGTLAVGERVAGAGRDDRGSDAGAGGNPWLSPNAPPPARS